MRIFIACEEQIVAKTFRDFLSDLGHDVVCFKSVCELLDEQEKRSGWADLIIIDPHAGNRNDTNLLYEVHKWSPEVPIIVTTTHESILPPDEAISYGVYAYLRKPISLAELELLLSRLPGRLSDARLPVKSREKGRTL